jgi:uncharacterized membrane protein
MLLNHHMLMRPVGHATNTLYWWNAHLLFWMSLIPLSTAALGDAPREPLAVAFYGAVLTANSISFTFLHRCAARLADQDGRLDDTHRRSSRKMGSLRQFTPRRCHSPLSRSTCLWRSS